MREGVDYLSAKDPVLKAVIERFGLPQIQRRDPGFAALCHIILEQQVSIASAKACYVKLESALGQITAENVLNASDAIFRECGVSRQKTSYLKDLAQRIESGSLSLESFAEKNTVEIAKELLEVKGIGNWTVEVYLMFCMQSPDVCPIGDIAIRHAIRELYNLESADEMLEHAKNWAPHRTLASYILWHHYLEMRKK